MSVEADHYELDAPEHDDIGNRFHPFMRLPIEIRCMIWKMAICYSKAHKIHYYELFHTDSDGRQHSRLQQMMRQNSRRRNTDPHPCWKEDWPSAPAVRGGYALPLPKTKAPARSVRKPRPSHFSWAAANRFQYLWDNGLRRACTESRKVLIKYAPRAPAPTQPWIGSGLQASQGRNSAQRTVDVIVHRQDLVCLRFAPGDMEACAASLSWQTLLACLPMFDMSTRLGPHLAFEFDASWNRGLVTPSRSMNGDSFLQRLMPEPSARGLVLRAYWAWLHGHIPPSIHVYLIEPCKEPTPERECAEPRPASWRLGRGVEGVRKPNFVDGQRQYVECLDDGRSRSPVHFFTAAMTRMVRSSTKYPYDCFDERAGAGGAFFSTLRPLPGSDGSGRG